ncbi:hypothetical protein OVO14_10980, partial [Streptococcus pneumoniae]|nr:hypothetical protein [Streptococcus pneumoniae]
GLLIRSLVERVTALLKPQDEICVLLLGTDSPSQIVPWTGSDAVEEGLLSRLLEPDSIGRAPDLWGNLGSLSPHLRTSTHLLVATAGSAAYPGKGL